MHLGPREREDEQWTFGQQAQEMIKRGDRRRIAPVQVLDDEHEGLARVGLGGKAMDPLHGPDIESDRGGARGNAIVVARAEGLGHLAHRIGLAQIIGFVGQLALGLGEQRFEVEAARQQVRHA